MKQLNAYILLIILLVPMMITCVELDIDVVRIDRFCHTIRYYNDAPSFDNTKCILIDYYVLDKLSQDILNNSNICPYITYIENFVSLEQIVDDLKYNYPTANMIFVYQAVLEIGFWQLKWNGEYEECFPVYEMDLSELSSYDNQTIFINYDNSYSNDYNLILFNQIPNPWVKFLYVDGNVYGFYFLGLLCHGGAFIHSCYHIYYVFFVFKDFPMRDKLVIILANLGNLLRVIYMLTDPMSVNHNLSRFWTSVFGSLSLPWSIMTWLFLAVKYNEILFSSIVKDDESIERNLDIKFGIVITIIIVLLIPQCVVGISTINNNYALELYGQIINMSIFLLVTIGMSAYYIYTTIKIASTISLINKSLKLKKSGKRANTSTFIYRSLMVLISSLLIILIIILGFVPAMKGYPFTYIYIFAIGWAVALAVTQITQVRLFSYKFVKPSTSSKDSKTAKTQPLESASVSEGVDEGL